MGAVLQIQNLILNLQVFTDASPVDHPPHRATRAVFTPAHADGPLFGGRAGGESRRGRSTSEVSYATIAVCRGRACVEPFPLELSFE